MNAAEPTRRPSPAVRRRRVIVIGAIAVVVVLALVWGVVAALGAGRDEADAEAAVAGSTTEPAEPEESAVRETPAAEPEPEPAPEETQPEQPPATTPAPAPAPAPGATPAQPAPVAGSIDDPNSFSVVVNKLRPLNPVSYAPADLVSVPVPYVWAPQLRAAASAAVVEMFAAFTAETGMQLQSQSAYRSYPTQVSTYNGYVGRLGQAGADQISARPGHSEHQTGLAIDISSLPAQCALQACFGQTAHGQWLAANAWRFGFTLRYPEGKTHITGYVYEPWHFRYVGPELATALHDAGDPTLEEYFGLAAAPNY